MINLEVIATTLEDVRKACDCGADRIELTVGLSEGALTPSLGLLEKVKSIATVPVFVMIRPRDGVCTYSDYELDAMAADAAVVRNIGLEGIVCGMLTVSRAVDVKSLQRILDACTPLPLVFHRAFDQVADPVKALKLLMGIGRRIPRLLTSGLKETAVEGIPMIQQLVGIAGEYISIMPGAGIQVEEIEKIITETGVKDIHLGIGVRTPPTPSGRLDGKKVEDAKRVIERLH